MPPHRRRPVLVVDDDPAMRRVVTDLLGDAGFPCVAAESGVEALRRMDEVPPSLILLDIQMPQMDGVAFARELRMRLRHVPLVVLTARDHPDREADRCNADAVLAKPFASDQLLGLVRRYAR